MAAAARLAAQKLKEEREHVIAFVGDVLRNSNADVLGEDFAQAISEPLAKVKTEAALRLLLLQLRRRLRGVVSAQGLREDWHQRCTEPTADGDDCLALCTELDEAIDWTAAAAWRTAAPAPAAVADEVDLTAAEQDAETEAIVQSLQERVDELEEKNKRQEEELESLRAQLRGRAEHAPLAPRAEDAEHAPPPSDAPSHAAAPAAAEDAGESDAVIDLTYSDDDVVDTTPPPAVEVAAASADAVAAASEEAAEASLPPASGAGPSGHAARGSRKREAAEAPPLRLVPDALAAAGDSSVPTQAKKQRRGLSRTALFDALRACAGQMPAAQAFGSKLHLLKEKSGVTCLHAAAFNDANAGVLALVLALAAADGRDALLHALQRQSGKDAHSSGFAVSGNLVLGAGATALDFACAHGAVECAALLLRAGADPNARTAHLHDSLEGLRLCPLDLAAAAGHLGIIRMLRRARAQPDSCDDTFGWTPLHWAAQHANVPAVRLLLFAGANPDAVDKEGRSALDWAMASDNGEAGDASEAIKHDCHDERVAVMVELFCAGATRGFPARADEPILVGGYGRTMLHACSGGLTTASLELLRRLLTAPALNPPLNLDVGAGELGTPLDLAVHAGWAEGALLLINRGASVSAPTKGNFTPLMRAAALPAPMGGSDLIRLICVKQPDAIEARDEKGRTAAHWAAVSGRVDALRTLRALGADLSVADSGGVTPAQLAGTQPGFNDVVNAPTCPPRTYRPGEDAACDQEEVKIAVPAATLGDDVCFITANVEAPGMTLNRPRDKGDTSRACCDCLLCIPGLCRCLSSRYASVCKVVEELDLRRAVDKILADETSRELRKGGAWRAVGIALCSVKTRPIPAFATGLVMAKSATAGLPAVGLAAALLALRHLLLPAEAGDALDAGWDARVRDAARLPDFAQLLSVLLLALDDAIAPAVRLDVQEAEQSRSVPVWRAKQGDAWLKEARPAWRASVRLGNAGGQVTPAALAEAMKVLLVSLRAVHEPLRIVPTASVPKVWQCSPRCLCAGGGCKASGVQYPLSLRTVGGIGIGLFTETFIPRGALVAPYVGEVTSAKAADAAEAAAAGDKPPHYYFLDLEASYWQHLRTPGGGGINAGVIDGTNVSNVTRYSNHSCEPNLRRSAVDWPGLEAGPLVFLYAAKDIKAGTELCWDYGLRGDKKGFVCACTKCAANKAEASAVADPLAAAGTCTRSKQAAAMTN